MSQNVIHLADKSLRIRARTAGVQVLRLASDLIRNAQELEGLSDEKLAEKSGVTADEIVAIKELARNIEDGVDPRELPEISVKKLTLLMASMGYEVRLSAMPKDYFPKGLG